MTALARPIVALLLIVWRFGIGRFAIVTVYAVFASFAWFVQGAVGAWDSASDYFWTGAAVTALFLGPAALVLGLTQPSRSWRWGLWLTWPTVLLSAYLLATAVRWQIAVIGLPLVVVPVICGVAWMAAIARESVGGLLAKPASNEVLEPNTSMMPMTAEELAAEASWDRAGKTRGHVARATRAKRRNRRP